MPSIVHGLFGLGAFVYAAGMGKSILAASLTLAIMTLPVIIASTREALAAVPVAFREACWNVGASRWQTIRSIVLRQAVVWGRVRVDQIGRADLGGIQDHAGCRRLGRDP